MLNGKNILLGVTGGIAAYKAPMIVRLLKKAGADIRVVMTPAAKDFVTPLTLSTVSENAVLDSFTSDDENATWNNHVELALWADYILFAPLTSNTLAKFVMGQSDNLLTAVYMSAKCPIYIAPAMDLDMYKNEATTRNLKALSDRGVHIIDAEEGELASGLVGKGRLAEPEHIVQTMIESVRKSQPLYGKKVLITAGPTYEPIDPVRFIGNRSTGKMGFAIADRAIELGAEVYLVSGPTTAILRHEPAQHIKVETALEMLNAGESFFPKCDIAIFTAAVSDYRVDHIADQKIKKGESIPSISLVENPDILKTLASQKDRQIVVGFALETENELENAKNKLEKKNADLIVLNSLQDPNSGFGHDTNTVYLISQGNSPEKIELKAKTAIAEDLWNYILKNWF